MNYQSALAHYNLDNQRVILRADLNVPINNGIITDDYRLKAILPTIDLILKKNGAITLLTHIGRPQKQEASLSTRILVQWFAARNYTISWASNIKQAQSLIATPGNPIVLLENLRFYPEEKAQDQNFALALSSLGNYYVNDAFGTLHRQDSSITLLPLQFKPDHRTIGLLVEKELLVLSKLIDNPAQPFVLILGGGKVKDKLPVIENLLTKTHTILLCPAIVATFLKARGQEVGKSLVDQTALELCKIIEEKAQKNNVRILVPVDYLIAHNDLDGILETVNADNFPADGIALSIGQKTIELYTRVIGQAGTIFFNCAMGFLQKEKSLEGTQKLLQAIANAHAFSVVGGGDSVAAVVRAGLSNKIGFLSTGGGATLTYLSGKKLPGLQALMQ